MNKLGFTFEVIHRRAGLILSVERVHNIMPIEGINSMFDVHFHAAPQITTWYVGIYEGDFTPVATTTMALLPAAAVETTTYTPVTRPVWEEAAPAAGSISNAAAEALFTMTADKTLFGAFLASSPVKGNTSGPLASATRFTTPKVTAIGDEIFVTVPFDLISTV